MIGVSQAKKQKELEEQGIYYQDGVESVEDWDDEEVLDETTEDLSDEKDELEGVEEDGNTIKSDDESDDNNDTDSGNTSDSDKKENNNNNDNSQNKKPSSQKEENKAPAKVPAAGKLTYEQYISMSPEKQEEYFEKFDSEGAFFEWYRTAKAEYDKNNEGNVVEGGTIDIGDYRD